MTIKFLGLEIERKTEIIAFVALVLSLITLSYQIINFVYNYARGPDVKMFIPEQIFINSYDYPDSGLHVRLGASLAYVNEAPLGYNDIIKKESVIFSFGKKKYKQVWQAFRSFEFKDSKLISHYKGDAFPVPINAGSAVSHETYFAPRSVRCPSDKKNCDKWKNYLKWVDFVKEIEKVKKLKFMFKSETYHGSQLTVECTIDIDKGFLDRLKTSEWAVPSCWDEE